MFAANQLVLAVPADGTVTSLDDLAKPGTTIAMGSESRAGRHATRARCSTGCPPTQKDAILANVRSNEPDVGGVVGKVAQGAVDAGFVYVTDVRGRRRQAEGDRLPADLKPQVAYGVAVVKGAKHPEQAQQFVDGLLQRRRARGARPRRLPAAAWHVTWFAALLGRRWRVVLAFLVLPVVAIFVDVGPGELLASPG